ncbi:MAG: hypothetical protein ACI9TH_000169 [Kiritimatiellia bacterium]|jgi:hypothetical protein
MPELTFVGTPMASRKKRKDDLDGFSVMKAAQQAADSKKKPSTDPPDPAQDSNASGTPTPGAKKSAYTKARRTAMPTVREIICLQCAYPLEIKGKLTQTVCHKCRTRLDLKDVTIDGEWEDDVETAGDITITPEAVVKAGTLVGNNITLAGAMAGGSLRATRSLSLVSTATFELADIEALDLVIPAEAEVDLGAQKASYRNVTIAGALTASLTLDGLLHIKSGGLFSGEYVGKHLLIDDGGGLKAKLKVEP